MLKAVLQTGVLWGRISKVQPARMVVIALNMRALLKVKCILPTLIGMHTVFIFCSKYSNWEWIEHSFSLHMQRPLTSKGTHALTHSITRRDSRLKYKQPLIAHSEVRFTRHHLTSPFFVTISIHCHHPTGSRPWYLRTVKWHYFKILAVHAGESCTLTPTQIQSNGHKPSDRQKTRCRVPTCAD